MSTIFALMGIASSIFTWIVVAWLIRKVSFDKSLSISKHAAQDLKIHRTYGMSMIFGLLLFSGFFWGWLVPNYDLPLLFKVLIMIIVVSEIIVVLIPDIFGWKTIVHSFFAYGVAAVMPFSLFYLHSQQFHLLTRLAATMAIIGMFSMWFLFKFMKRSHERYFIFQSLYYVLFHIAILSTLVRK